MLQQNQLPAADTLITITPAAINEAKRLLTMEQKADLFLRLGISSGGCSGMSYSMSFDDQPSELDREFDFDGLRVRVDLKALMYLKGTTVDYETGLMGGGFKFINPNAKRSCGCGSSFTC
jgi:iron-sulfur cluster assembly protein